MLSLFNVLKSKPVIYNNIKKHECSWDKHIFSPVHKEQSALEWKAWWEFYDESPPGHAETGDTCFPPLWCKSHVPVHQS